MPGDQFKFFCYLIAHAATQSTPGVVLGDAYSLSRACRCKPESVPQYVSRLIEAQLIQHVSEINSPILEENKEEKSRKEGPSAGFPSSFKSKFDRAHSELRDAFDLIPADIRRAMELELGFNSYYVMAQDESHKLTEEKFKENILSGYPGQCRDFDFAFSYCRLVLHSNRGVSVLRSAIQKYISTRESNFQQLENFLKSKWWDLLRDDRGNWPKSIRENLAAVAVSGSDIIYQIGQ